MDKIVDCVFDEMSGVLGECISIYKKLKPLYPKEKRAIAGSMTQANDKKVTALQAADLLAGQLTTNLRLGRPEKHSLDEYIADSKKRRSGHPAQHSRSGPVEMRYAWAALRVCRGMTYDQIAEMYHLSPQAVAKMVAKICDRVGLST